MWFQIIVLYTTHLLIPACFIHALWGGRCDSRIHWLVKALYISVFLVYMFLVGRWDWVSYYLRFVWLALLAAALVVSYLRTRRLPWIRRDRRWWLGPAGGAAVLLLFLAPLVLALRGFVHPDRAVRLEFPLRDGWYYVAQGGNNPLLNHHNTHQSQQFALDIVEINALGARAAGMYPRDPERYVIFSAAIYSPCDGIVKRAVDRLPDLRPPETDRDHAAGNHIVIACRSVDVVLAHLLGGSVAVERGEMVTTGQWLGRVGNSGNTTEPHLHMHAVRPLEGEGVSMILTGDRAVRNTLFAM